MTKPHKHAELIKAWADGAEIEVYMPRGGNNEPNLDYEWCYCPNPHWNDYYKYRIKPRKFEEGAYYPIVFCSNNPDYKPRAIVRYAAGLFQVNEHTIDHHEVAPKELLWIGEPLNIKWPEDA